MTPNNNSMLSKAVLLLLALFLTGGVSGYAVSSRLNVGRPAWTQTREWAKAWVERRIEQDIAATDATPAQQAAIKASYDKLLAEFLVVQAEASNQMTVAFKRHGAEVGKILDAKQREALRLKNLERSRNREER
jgi:hypothetical protein